MSGEYIFEESAWAFGSKVMAVSRLRICKTWWGII
jgi:hypothetical protein